MYSSVSKVKKSLGDKGSLLLSGVSSKQLTEILANSTDIINSYIGVVYGVCPPSVPQKSQSEICATGGANVGGNALLEHICISLCKAELYRRYASNDIPSDVVKQEEKAYKDLEKIQRRELVIESGQTASVSNFSVSDRVFNRRV